MVFVDLKWLGCWVILLGATFALPGAVPPEDAPLDWFDTKPRGVRPPAPSGGGGAGPARTALPGLRWLSQGPGPAINGQVEGIEPDNEVAGAVQVVLPHPTDPDLLYLGAVNGGVWRAKNAQAARPIWQPLTDQFSSLSIGALVFDATDSTARTLVAGIGRFSSFGGQGGALTGLLRSTDGGDNWVELGQGDLSDANISGVIARGNLLVVGSDDRFGRGGIFRSTDGGLSFQRVTAGLPPAASVSHLVADRVNGTRFYAAVVRMGVFRSDDGGSVWTNITRTNSVLEMAFRRPGNNNAKLAAAVGGRLYAAALGNGQLEAFGYTDTATAISPTWVDMDLPRLPAGSFRAVQGASNASPVVIVAVSHGLSSGDRVLVTGVTGNAGANGTFAVDVLNANAFALRFSQGTGQYLGGGQWIEVIGVNPRVKPGAQGSIHFSIQADPEVPERIYLGGDRQEGPLPNLIGARDFTGTLWRGNTLMAPGGQVPSAQWVHLTHMSDIPGLAGGGTASRSAPHADCRDLAFDAAGRLIEADDGGIYVRTRPRDDSGDWFSINGNLQVTEIHDVAYDGVSGVLISGNQDTGVTQQTGRGSSTWSTVLTGDGGDVAVDDLSLASMGRSLRYLSFQRLLGFQRQTYDENNRLIGTAFPALRVQGSGLPLVAQFVTPMRLHSTQPERLLIGGGTAVYESFDRGESLTEIGRGLGANTDAMLYGHPLNPDLVVIGSGLTVWQRSLAGGTLTRTVSSFPGGLIRGVAVHPADLNSRFVFDESRAFRSMNEGRSWTDVTGNVGLVSGGELRGARVVSVDGAFWLVAGASWGVVATPADNPGDWRNLASGLPHAPVWDLEYDPDAQLLVAGTLGRGAWQLGLGLATSVGHLAEWFSANDNDLAFQVFTFTPDESESFYSVCQAPAQQFSVDPSDGVVLSLEDDGFAEILLNGAAMVSLFGESRDRLFVGSNGYLTFDTGDSDFSESLADHFARLRISLLFDDLNPETAGRVSWQQLEDRVVVTFENVREFGVAEGNSFQAELFLDGVIRLTYLSVSARDALIGVSRGTGTPADFVETDFSSAAPCEIIETLQHLINAAEPGSILTLAAGTRFETLTIDKDLVLEWPGPSQAVLDGRGQGPVVHVRPQAQVILRGVSLRNGFVTDGAGGIWNQGELTLENVVLTGHRSMAGPAGAILNQGVLHMNQCEIVSCSAEEHGAGGIRNEGTVFLIDSRVRDSRGIEAGALWNSGEAVLIQARLTGNCSSEAGGLFNESVAALTNTTVQANQAEQGRGGGILNSRLAALYLLNTTVASNQSGLFLEGGGGGIDNAGVAAIRSSTISGNQAPTGSGGGLYNHPDGILQLFNSTVVQNSASGSGGGVENLGRATLGSSLVAANNSDSGADLAGSFLSLGFNLVQIPEGWESMPPSPSDLVGLDPLISPLSDFGGATRTHRLQPGSPAVDRGQAFAGGVDQRGRLRPQDASGILDAIDGTDIGAVESDPTDSVFVDLFESGLPRRDISGWVGMQFTVGPTPVELTALGRWLLPGNTEIHSLRLMRAETGQIVTSVSIDAATTPADRFHYGTLPEPVLLEARTSYWLVSQEREGMDFWLANARVNHRSLARLDGPVLREGEFDLAENSLTLLPSSAHGLVDFIYVPCPGAPGPQVTFGTPRAPFVRGLPASLSLDAFDCDGTVASISVWEGETLLGVLEQPPYELLWTNQSAGELRLQAEVVDNAGLSSRSETSVTVVAPAEESLVRSLQPGRPRRDFSGWVGWRLTVGVNPIRVVALARLQLAGNTQTHRLRLLRATDGVEISGGSTEVTMGGEPAGAFVYGPLPETLLLEPGQSYDLLSEETAGGDQFLDLDTVLQPSPEASVDGPVWGLPQSGLNFQAGLTGRGYVPLNLKYWILPSNELVDCMPNPVMPLVANVQPGTPRANFSGWVGMRFTVGNDALEVLRLGRWALAANSRSHRLKLVLAANGMDVPGGGVDWVPSGTTGFHYAELASPIPLEPGESYYLVSAELAGADFWLELDSVVALQGAQAAQPVWGIGQSWNLVGSPGRAYGPVDLQFRVVPIDLPEIFVSGTLTASGFRVVVDGPDGPLLLEASDDLRSWRVFARRTIGTGPWIIIDAEEPSHRFYRARCGQ